MTTEIPQHFDKLGQPLSIGDCIVYPQSNALIIGTVRKFNPKMIGVTKVDGRARGVANKYPQDVVKIDSQLVTVYLLKKSVNSK